MRTTLRLRASLLALLAVLFCGCASQTSTPTQDIAPDPALIGVWEGTLNNTLAPNEPLHLRLAITKAHVDVWMETEGAWAEVKRGAFTLRTTMTNAEITGSDAGTDRDGTWVESWALLATLRTHDELLVTWSRIVNNLEMPLQNPFSKFSAQGSGTMVRVAEGSE